MTNDYRNTKYCPPFKDLKEKKYGREADLPPFPVRGVFLWGKGPIETKP